MAKGGYRAGAGRPKGAKNKRHASDVGEGKNPLPVTDTDAPDFLRQVWNDPNVEMALRIRAAEIVVRSVPKMGKKETKADRANAVGSGKFAPSAPPNVVHLKK